MHVAKPVDPGKLVRVAADAAKTHKLRQYS
jgi:hypothetical protein